MFLLINDDYTFETTNTPSVVIDTLDRGHVSRVIALYAKYGSIYVDASGTSIRYIGPSKLPNIDEFAMMECGEVIKKFYHSRRRRNARQAKRNNISAK